MKEISAMNKNTIITAVSSAYAIAAAVSFALGFMLGPKQALADDLPPSVYSDLSMVNTLSSAYGCGITRFRIRP